MAYEEELAEVMRTALANLEVVEKKMFGGLCFMLRGNMLCGVHGDGGMARVGKEHEEDARKLRGVGELAFTGRPMGGFVELTAEAIEDDTIRGRVLDLAIDYVGAMPAK